MDSPPPDTPSRRYHDVARFFRAYASAANVRLISRPASVEEIEGAERELGAPFPLSYRWFQLDFGDIQDGPLEIYSARTAGGDYANIVGINLKERTELRPHLPTHLIAFSDNGAGDHLCFDTTRREGDEYPVVWWDHEQDDNNDAGGWRLVLVAG